MTAKPRKPRAYTDTEKVDVYAARVSALEALVAHYRAGMLNLPETLHRKLEWTRLCINAQGEWIWPEA